MKGRRKREEMCVSVAEDSASGKVKAVTHLQVCDDEVVRDVQRGHRFRERRAEFE
tara:strand:+ start:398 stop:562 length:165 start_codon:yes stop_codon:yes gene_type:complete